MLNELCRHHLEPEATAIGRLLEDLALAPERRGSIGRVALDLVAAVRREPVEQSGLEAFLGEYDLGSREGVVLMSLAEALLRVPDPATADRLIHDQLTAADWRRHVGHSPSLLVNAATWGLALTGRLIDAEPALQQGLPQALADLLARGGESMVRRGLKAALGVLAGQFVMGATIEQALARSRGAELGGALCSFDMLGEAALCEADAAHYLAAYRHAIDCIAAGRAIPADPWAGDSISVKLSALHPRYQFSQRRRVLAELGERLCGLLIHARVRGVAVTLDAEESERLELSLELLALMLERSELTGWDGLGLAVQAYQKRAPGLIERLAGLADARDRPIAVRLVKGAYWDAEIKRAQELGLADYPVFTRKAHTDLCYLACARRLLGSRRLLPQFATHNAHTLAAILELAGNRVEGFELQRLHGMGETLYRVLAERLPGPPRVRVYAPVGLHRELLPYLVRRLLENGANSSFVNRIRNPAVPAEALVADPLDTVVRDHGAPHPRIPLPADLFGIRRNSTGIDLADADTVTHLQRAVAQQLSQRWDAGVNEAGEGILREVRSPVDTRRLLGQMRIMAPDEAPALMARAAAAAPAWGRLPVTARAALLERAADRFEAEAETLLARCVGEGGRTLADAHGELREAVDACRYYAHLARGRLASERLPGPSGEENRLARHGRGVFVCISPWNFPLAIFTAQVAAALVAGNTVVAKPAGQTPFTAAQVVKLLHAAGVPRDVLQLATGTGAKLGMALVEAPECAGVVFTGSTATARTIARTLAARPGPLVPLIAETGGQNAMIVDSSALPEQVVTDVIRSAFNSAGQRCSALRVLFLQREIADGVLELLAGAMAELRIGDPALVESDIGPLIDADARHALEAHVRELEGFAKNVYRCVLPPGCESGAYFAPQVWEIDRLERLHGEVFGPVLHVVRFDVGELERVVDAINATGYGLTLGIHSRVQQRIDAICARARVGNIYVNRNMIGAVIGVQPFGGEGLSGTGPKAGGPDYLVRFVTERVVSSNTAAVGGNLALLGLGD